MIDLDGVVWRGSEGVAGSADAVARLHDRGVPVVFATNNSTRSVAAVERRLATFGIRGQAGVVTSSQAVASLVSPGEIVLVVGEDGLRTAVRGRGAEVVDAGPADAVVVGLFRQFDYQVLRAAMAAVEGGARLLATNTDPAHPSSEGLEPGSGALVAAVATATGVAPTIAGKPEAPMADLIRGRFGPPVVCVGDRPETDGRFAVELGCPFALVLSGVTSTRDLPVDPEPLHVAGDLAEVVSRWFHPSGGRDHDSHRAPLAGR